MLQCFLAQFLKSEVWTVFGLFLGLWVSWPSLHSFSSTKLIFSKYFLFYKIAQLRCLDFFLLFRTPPYCSNSWVLKFIFWILLTRLTGLENDLSWLSFKTETSAMVCMTCLTLYPVLEHTGIKSVKIKLLSRCDPWPQSPIPRKFFWLSFFKFSSWLSWICWCFLWIEKSGKIPVIKN